MSIENFLNQLAEKEKDNQRKIEIAKAQKEDQEVKRLEYFDNFNNYYSQTVIPVINFISTKLGAKFQITPEPKPTTWSYNTIGSKITFLPKFTSTLKQVEFSISCESDRKLITISSTATDNKLARISGIYTFQQPFEKFIELSLEEFIAKSLSNYFI